MKFFIIIMALLSLNISPAYAGEGGRGADDVSRYLNLIKFYIVPDILSTVHPDSPIIAKSNIKIRQAYENLYEGLLKGSDTLNFHPSKNPLKDTSEPISPWIATGEEVGSPILYNTAAYRKRFGDNYDVIVIAQHVFHEIGHWYQLPEDVAWQFAYVVTGTYVKRCETINSGDILLNDGACQAFELVRRANVKNGKPVISLQRTLEKMADGQTCLEGYFNSERNLTTGIAAHDETVDMVTQVLSSQRKDYLPDNSFLWGFITEIGFATLGLPFVLNPELFALDAIAFGWGSLGISPFAGWGVEAAMHKEILEANKKVDEYNQTVDHAVWVVNRYGASKADRLLLLDRQFTYAILSEASTGATETLRASLEGSDPIVMKLKFSGKVKIDEINLRLKALADSRQLCTNGLPTAADLGLMTALINLKGVQK